MRVKRCPRLSIRCLGWLRFEHTVEFSRWNEPSYVAGRLLAHMAHMGHMGMGSGRLGVWGTVLGGWVIFGRKEWCGGFDRSTSSHRGNVVVPDVHELYYARQRSCGRARRAEICDRVYIRTAMAAKPSDATCLQFMTRTITRRTLARKIPLLRRAVGS